MRDSASGRDSHRQDYAHGAAETRIGIPNPCAGVAKQRTRGAARRAAGIEIAAGGACFRGSQHAVICKRI